jgi:prevent-host-death family protein
MRTITATEASRGFSDLLNEVAGGATIRIERNGEPVAEIRPTVRHTYAALKAALVGTPPLDADFESDIADALTHLTSPEVPTWDATR